MADAPSGNGASGGGSDNPGGFNAEDLARMVNDAVSKAIGARMKRLNLEEQISAAVEKTLAGKTAPSPADDAGNAPAHSDPERVNLKTLDSNYKALKQELERERQARQLAEQSATQTRLRSDLHSAFAKHVGADSPHLNAYLNLYANQFKVHEGTTYHLRKDEFGNEEMVPLDVAADQLFKSELKHLVPSKTPNLPPSSIARGMPMSQPAQQQGQPRTGFLEQEIMHSQAMSDPALFAELYGPGTKK